MKKMGNAAATPEMTLGLNTKTNTTALRRLLS